MENTKAQEPSRINEAFSYQLPNDVSRCSICDKPTSEHNKACTYVGEKEYVREPKHFEDDGAYAD